MRDSLLLLPLPVLVLVIVGGSALLAVLATHLVRLRFDEQVHTSNNEVAGFIFSAVGVVYGVLLAFLVLVVWQTFEEAQVTVESEANTLVNIHRLGQEFPEPLRTQTLQLTTSYGEDVVNDEWYQMQFGRSSEKVEAAMDGLWQVHLQLDQPGDAGINHREQFFDLLNTLGNDRRVRVLQSRLELPGLMWALLIGGGIVTLGFTLFLRAPNWKAHLAMAAMFAGLVAFVLLLIIELDNPFSGDVKIQPIAFQQALESFARLRGN
jgi:hypothetical protein